MTSLKDFLKTHFPDEVIAILAGLIDRAYKGNTDCHDPALGHDEMTFGLLLYKSIKRFINITAEKMNWLEVIKSAPQFIFKINGLQMSAYRAANPDEMDPNKSFPKNHGGAYIIATENIQRSFYEIWLKDEKEWNESELPPLILAYKGTYETGLSQIFVAIPKKVDEESKTISEWEETLVLWQRGEDADPMMMSLPPDDSLPPAAPSETVAPPNLSLRKVAKAGGEE